MKCTPSSYLSVLCAINCLAAVLGLELQALTEPKPRSFSFQKVKRDSLGFPSHPQNRKRAETVLQYIDNLEYLYYANVSIGTPPQSLRLHLDTGSSDIWVESATSSLCRSPSKPCANSGTFDKDDSSTYQRLNSDFQISYVDGDYARGDYGTDVLRLGDETSVTGLQFGIGLDSTSTEGIMGIGLPQNQVQVQRLGREPYRGLTDLMVEQNLIKSRAYSLWLNSLQSSTGEVLFGGIDTAKFSGNLTTLPINKRSPNSPAREFMITLTKVSLTNHKLVSLSLTDNEFSIPILLDTGSSYNYLPSELAKTIAKQVGAQWAHNFAVPILPCGIRNYNGTINFEFSGQQIKVPLNQLIIDAYTNNGDRGHFSDGSPICYFGIMDAGENSFVFGDTFLRSAYVVYDIDNEEISIGQALHNVTDSNILEIKAGKKSVPDATGAVSTITAVSTTTSRGNGFPIPSEQITRVATVSLETAVSIAIPLKAYAEYTNQLIILGCLLTMAFSR
ncbi:aspartic peptidase domain-containing protein [Geopyxis carbonaria]|nr:aspartic peptidase domain-containing protein [Geopyxis carbonaria]